MNTDSTTWVTAKCNGDVALGFEFDMTAVGRRKRLSDELCVIISVILKDIAVFLRPNDLLTQHKYVN